MPTRQQVLELRRRGAGYEAIGAQLGVPPGQAYLIGTGFPADGGDGPSAGDMHREGLLPGSTQHLANPPHENPTTKDSVIEWIRRRALDDRQMARAAASRDAEPGDPEEPDVTDIVAVLTRRHDAVTALVKQLDTIPGVKKGGTPVHLSRRKSIVDLITVELSKHEATEERMFWPAVRDTIPDGDSWAAHGLRQEQEGKDTLTALGKLSPDEEEFDDLVERLHLQLRKHVALEDSVLLQLTGQLSEEVRQELGERFRSAEQHAPTRPHRHAPKKPPGVQIAGAAGAAMDKVRDSVGDRPAERKGRASKQAKKAAAEQGAPPHGGAD